MKNVRWTISLFIFLSIFISCSSSQYSINEGLSSQEIVKEMSRLREEYSGDDLDLNTINSYAELLLKRKENTYEALVMKAWVTLRKGYINEGVGFYRKNMILSYKIMSQAIGEQKMRWEGWSDLAHLYIEARDFKRAEAAINKFNTLNINQSDQNFLYKKSILMMNYNNSLGKYKTAQVTYKVCVKNVSNKYQKRKCLHQLALSYPENHKQVLRIRKHILKLHPNSAWDLGNLGGAYFKLKEYDRAIKYYEKAISIRKYGVAQSHLADLYLIKAKGHFENGQRDIAIEYINKFRSLNYYNDSNVEYATVVIRSNLGNNELILDVLEEAEESDDNSGKIKSLIGEYYFKNKDFKEARKYFISAISSERRNTLKSHMITYVGTRIAFISMWKLETKDYDVALKWLLVSSKYLKEDDDFASSLYYYLGSAYHEKSWIEKDIKLSKLALNSYKNALKYDDIEHEKIYKNMRRVRVNIRNFSKNI
ncbi:tetratricopeptide repeat protein [Halobacteriovorax sp. YZS-1-1]|uniref:tetratricopeptide repeat protein n=1 Tax=unclassified Halobacteriovorax TaxID=2639665 RepID=UPI00399949F4